MSETTHARGPVGRRHPSSPRWIAPATAGTAHQVAAATRTAASPLTPAAKKAGFTSCSMAPDGSSASDEGHGGLGSYFQRRPRDGKIRSGTRRARASPERPPGARALSTWL
jgi:hypothetical protein